MRPDAWFVSALLAQASEAHASPWVALVASLLGGGGLLAIVLKDYLRGKGERERAAAEEERARREAKHKAEIEQIEALTSLARGVPEQFRLLGERFDKALDKIGERIDGALGKIGDASREHDKQLVANTAAVEHLATELANENRELLDAVAEELGVRRDARARVDVTPARPADPPRSIRAPLGSRP